MKEVSGKVAFITGGASGIGHAMARAFVNAGMKVAIADIDAERLGPAATELDATGDNVLLVRLDVTDRDGWQRAADKTEQKFGAIHVVCNNAGIEAIGWTVEEIPVALWDRQIGINLTGVFNGAHYMIPRIKKHGQGGHIINTASISGLRARARHPAYIAAKHAVVGLSDALRAELAKDNIGVSVLCPGAVGTRLHLTSKVVRGGVGSVTPPHQEVVGTAEPSAQDVNWYGQRVLQALRDNEFFVLSHPEYRDLVTGRHNELLAAFERAETIAKAIGYTPNRPR
ncbi:MAG: SDR family NAD(P)-dependent oxidoreductase [Betaproteobacteria bacterium]|nr:SDR family NAD(P)-dependent oxidoreductase [Betaproteobacteria bacterium]